MLQGGGSGDNRLEIRYVYPLNTKIYPGILVYLSSNTRYTIYTMSFFNFGYFGLRKCQETG